MQISATTAPFRCGLREPEKRDWGEQKNKTHKAQLEPQPAFSYAQFERVCSGEKHLGLRVKKIVLKKKIKMTHPNSRWSPFLQLGRAHDSSAEIIKESNTLLWNSFEYK